MNQESLLAFCALALVLAPVARCARADWRAEADRRIERHRKGDFAVECTGADGERLGGAEVAIRQTRSHFHFGTAIGGRPWADAPDERSYRRFILDHFNTLVCENHMKWYAIGKRRGRFGFEMADRYLAFARENDLAMRGHCLFWSKKKYVQDWVRQLTDAELRREIDAYLEAVVPHFRGKLIAWDVNNEMLDGSYFKERLGDQIRVHMFTKAHALDPATPLFVNEYGILGSDEKTGRCIDLVRRLRIAGAPVGGIGIQEHGAQRFAPKRGDGSEAPEPPQLRPREAWRRLDRLAKLGLPIHLTEVSAATKDPQRRAEAIEAVFRTGFAHPKVEAILLWGFWARRHWLGAKAALVARDWTLTPAGKRLEKLLLEQWRTRTEARSDAAGKLRFRGFYGTYELTVEQGGQPWRAEITVTPGQEALSARFRPVKQE